jgi:hypothetical protein
MAKKSSPLGSAGHPLNMKINKRFFVSMLTRDIELEDAILDLLDNCLDGVIRTTNKSLESQKPYRGHWAKLTIAPDTFVIEDNCGGIPRDLIERAFGIGRSDEAEDHHRTIGMYGIGMKRAIFKMALEAKVASHGDFGFEVKIDESWLKDKDKWRLEYRRTQTPFHHGTRITVTRLRPEISKLFETDRFQTRLNNFISLHYAVILNKGFQVKINGVQVEPAPVSILSTPFEDTKSGHPALIPYMFRWESQSVSVRLWVGMYRKPTDSDGEDENETEQRQSSDNSGWTIICNDRAVVSNDTSILTGWGDATVPRFHPQFIGIRGILVMDSDHPIELPLTTTKRGLDAASILYLSVKEYMREGTKIFTNFTNNWKSDRIKAKKLFDAASLLELGDLKTLMDDAPLSKAVKLSGAERFKPELPLPEPTAMKRISFQRHRDQISKVRAFLLDDARATPSEVGAACFDDMLLRAEKS